MTTIEPSGARTRRHPLGRWIRRLPVPVAAASLLLLPAGLVGSAAAASAASPGPATCTGSVALPGSLAGGTYSSVGVSGVCYVDSGQVVVNGTLTVGAGAALVAAFAHDKGGPGTSGLTVHGDVSVGGGGTLVLGCKATSFPCQDDNQGSPTLNSPATVDGSVVATDPLGVIVHDTSIGADAIQGGGGGDGTCTTPTTGVFSMMDSPVFSDYEDNTIGGNLRVTGLDSCWFGGLRNRVGGSVTFSDNSFADPDAMETVTNQVAGNLLCSGNSPAVHYGDSGGTPNVVGGFANGRVRVRGAPAQSGSVRSAPAGRRREHLAAGLLARGARRRGVQLRSPVLRLRVRPGGGPTDHRHGRGAGRR